MSPGRVSCLQHIQSKDRRQGLESLSSSDNTRGVLGRNGKETLQNKTSLSGNVKEWEPRWQVCWLPPTLRKSHLDRRQLSGGKYLTHKNEVLRLNLQNPRRVEWYCIPGYPTLCSEVGREHPEIISSVSTMANDKSSCLRQGRKWGASLGVSSNLHTHSVPCHAHPHTHEHVIYTQALKINDPPIYQ